MPKIMTFRKANDEEGAQEIILQLTTEKEQEIYCRCLYAEGKAADLAWLEWEKFLKKKNLSDDDVFYFLMPNEQPPAVGEEIEIGEEAYVRLN